LAGWLAGAIALFGLLVFIDVVSNFKLVAIWCIS